MEPMMMVRRVRMMCPFAAESRRCALVSQRQACCKRCPRKRIEGVIGFQPALSCGHYAVRDVTEATNGVRIRIDGDGNTQAFRMLAQPPVKIQSVGAGVQFNRLQATILVMFSHVFENRKQVHFVALSSLENAASRMAQNGGGWMVDHLEQFFGVVHFVSASPFGHGVDAGDHIVQLCKHVVRVVKFTTLKNI